MDQRSSAWREAMERYIREQALPVEKYGHQPRLYALTLQIGAGLAYDDDVVCAAAWMHDLGVFAGHRPDDPAKLAAWDMLGYAECVVPGLLPDFGFSVEKVPAVMECIRTHQPQFEPVTLEATILRDADILEQLGAVGILRTVCKVGRDTRFHTFTDAVRSLTRSLETLPGQLRLDVSKHLVQDRLRMHREFLDAAAREAGGMLF